METSAGRGHRLPAGITAGVVQPNRRNPIPVATARRVTPATPLPDGFA